jgi:PPM family protein phosphatase
VYTYTIMPQTLSRPFVISSFGASDRGLIRSKNEDNFLIDDDRQVYAVADGLGGVPNGEKASLLAVQMIREYYDDAVLRGDLFLRDMIDTINRSVYNEGHRLSPDLGMATTLTIAQVHHDRLSIGHVGDSGLFLYRAGTLRQITAEHTMKAAVCKNLSPEDCANVPDAFSHTLTRCIGHLPSVEADILDLPLQAGDRLLLCTDGVSKYVDPQTLENAFAVAPTPEALVRTLIREAESAGGCDNATALAIYVKGTPPRIFGLSAQAD